MAYKISIQFKSDSAASAFSKQLLPNNRSLSILHIEKSETTLVSNDSGKIVESLYYLKAVPYIQQIIVRDDDGWECEEIDLLSEDDISGLSHSLCSTDIHNSYCSGSNIAHNNISDDVSCCWNTDEQKVPKRLILASQSPRRQELLSLIGFPFTAEAADIDEDSLTEELKQRFSNEPFSIMAAMTVMNLARSKAQKLLELNPDAIVIGSDTIVTIDESILGKPSSRDDAFTMLKSLAGRDHHVFTGVSIISNDLEETFFTVTRVGFYPWSRGEEDLARRYIATGLPLDKAGAYGIQDMGALFIRGIKGDYYTVMGMPVSEVYRRLKKFGIT